ncbi:hypothetical protein AAON49_08195 [Pseudotenacibaculum sp. MALMAid0570]|uniref:hypothetical protein n=1 Tax=Pseudotenacibaculum sp. MALMAid0570 TaxID=3143938 RepID=UPI0032DFB129
MKNLNHIIYKSFFSLCFLMLTALYSFSQTNVVQGYNNHYKYSQEDFHLRFNKEAYYPSEKAWFQAFVTDTKTKKLFLQTKKASLLVYNQQGRLIAKNDLRFQNGISNFFIQIPTSYTSSSIYYKMVSSWSKNFDANDLYELKIYNSKKENKIDSPLKTVSFFPESGILIQNTNTFIGVKTIDVNGEGIAVNGKIKDENDKIVGVFKTDISGIGKFRFRPVANMKYVAEITEDSEYRKFELPKIKSSGVLINVVEKEDAILFYFKSKDFIPKNKPFVIIHSKGNIAISSPINLKEGQVFFSFPKQKLLKGLNTITLFDGFSPIAERHFFNDYGISSNKEDVLIQAKRVSIDSVEFELRNWLPNSQMFLSVSILPEENELVKKNNFRSDFYLKNILTQNDYFNYFKSQESISRINTHLLTYTREKDKWKQILEDTITIKNDFTSGFTVKGKLLDRKGNGLSNTKVDFFTDNQIGYTNTDNLGHFLLKDLNVDVGDKVILSAEKGKGNRRQISFEIFEEENTHDTIIQIKKKTLTEVNNIVQSPFVDDSEVLKEVIVKGNSKKEEEDTFINPMDKSTFNESFKITKDQITKYRDVLSYLGTRGGIRVINNAGSIYIFSTRTKHQTILGRNNFGVGGGSPGNMMNVYVNRTLIRASQFEILKEITLDQVKSIKINRSGIGDGGKNPFGSINIYLTNESVFGYKNTKNDSSFRYEFLTKKGFSKSVPYEAPNYLYDSYSKEYKKHATLYWQPNIQLTNIPYKLKVEIPENIHHLKVVIQGMTSDGSIVDFTKEISLKD